jgi:glycosyltransferase involved in cell wall biosynthesis
MKKSSIIISIITINLNNKEGLKNTLNSILIQNNLENIEWILIDGNSNDGSFDYLNNYQLPFKHKLISEKDKGIYFAMNKGIQLSNGTLVIFLNSGDTFMHNNCIQLIYNIYYKHSSDLMLFGFKYQNHLKYPKPLFWRFWGMPTSHQAMVYSRKLLLENIYDTKFKLAGDYDNFMKICTLTKKINNVNELLIINENYGSNTKLNVLKEEYKYILINYTNFLFGIIINQIKFTYLSFILKYRD